MFMSFSETGKSTIFGNIDQFQSGAMVACQVGSKNAAKNIADKARQNLESMTSPASDAVSTGTPLKKGIGYAGSGNDWHVFSMPVPAGEGQMKMPAPVEFGRGPLPSRPNHPYRFRQKPGVSPKPYAKGVEPKPYFRNAIQDAKDMTRKEVNKGLAGVLP